MSLGPLGGSAQLDFHSNGRQARASEVLLSFLLGFSLSHLFLFLFTCAIIVREIKVVDELFAAIKGRWRTSWDEKNVLPSLLVLLSCRLSLMRGVLRRQADIVDIGPGYIPKVGSRGSVCLPARLGADGAH